MFVFYLTAIFGRSNFCLAPRTDCLASVPNLSVLYTFRFACLGLSNSSLFSSRTTLVPPKCSKFCSLRTYLKKLFYFYVKYILYVQYKENENLDGRKVFLFLKMFLWNTLQGRTQRRGGREGVSPSPRLSYIIVLSNFHIHHCKKNSSSPPNLPHPIPSPVFAPDALYSPVFVTVQGNVQPINFKITWGHRRKQKQQSSPENHILHVFLLWHLFAINCFIFVSKYRFLTYFYHKMSTTKKIHNCHFQEKYTIIYCCLQKNLTSIDFLPLPFLRLPSNLIVKCA